MSPPEVAGVAFAPVICILGAAGLVARRTLFLPAVVATAAPLVVAAAWVAAPAASCRGVVMVRIEGVPWVAQP